ncbi:serine hydrolase [Rhodopirellula sp. MGV]|uniref:serine hydrolase n=1 Tax=Rhodopirellula sp. MGV TaxID=2023130 RepID=UPI000B97103C|nr:serine hydrolase [Rhodopirellula sp. MGV]OYP38235.1 D-aminoacylase [Rhodopirellula sp. MGV]PNY38572.1 D-aminoacylase [Rhodopirellula baltica]
MMRPLILGCLAWMVLTSVAHGQLDLVIRHGRIVDGTGAPWYVADIGISDGKIVKLGSLQNTKATKTIDAKGLVVAPGFIDMMGQTASPMLADPKSAINLLTQGITTINAGEGASAAPLGQDEERHYGYTTMAEYFAMVDSHGLPVNLVQTVGHTQIRQIVIGDTDRRPSDDELQEMKSLVAEAMQAGAIGVSTALIYPPAVYAPTKEIAELSAEAGKYGGRYYTHMRNEGDRLLEAIDEALDVGRTAEVPVHIFHLKAAGEHNWGKMELALAKIKSARRDGQQVTADIYPYINNGLGIAALIHPKHFEDGHARLIAQLDDPELRRKIREEMESEAGWENWFRHAGQDWERIVVGRSNHPRYQASDGKSLSVMARAAGEDPWDTFFELVKTGAFALPQTMSDANKIKAIREEFVSFCTDVGPAGGSRSTSHPRAFGSFPRLLSRYVRDLGVISLERAVAQASAVAANDVMAYDRGRIAIGLAADIIIFDENKIADHATFESPDALSEGMRYVVVNGELVLDNGKQTDARPGRVLRGPGYQSDSAPSRTQSSPATAQTAVIDKKVTQFMRDHSVPGAAIAIADHGKVVFTGSYGYADIAKKSLITDESLFRIASLSKPITAVAVLQLIEQGKLDLETPVLEILDLEEEIQAAGDQFDPRFREVTVRHLLEHRGGWDRDESFDAMFRSVEFAQKFDLPPPAGPQTVIRAMLRQPLDFDPGLRYAYSNFGYCLLGRVIETVSGHGYEDFVRQSVLAPIGITSMRLGKSRLRDRSENEVRYYDVGEARSVFAEDLNETVPWPYGGWYLEAMDAHGAWIASATDLAKFAAAMSDPNQSPLLSPESCALMDARPPGLAGFDAEGNPKARYYSLGWSNVVVSADTDPALINHWHTGSLSGTATILIRRHDGKSMVALFNTRSSPQAGHLGSAIDPMLHELADLVETN